MAPMSFDPYHKANVNSTGNLEVERLNTQRKLKEPLVWVSYVDGDGGEYLSGVLALYGSIVRNVPHFNNRFVLVVACGELASENISLLTRNRIEIRYSCFFPSENNMKYERLRVNWKTLKKLEVFTLLKHFRKLIYIDADMHFLRNPVKLYAGNQDSEFQAVPSQQLLARFNTGIFIVESDFELVERIGEEFKKMTHCSGQVCQKYIDRMSKVIDDQGFLNVFFERKWKPLPLEYNIKVMFYAKSRMWGARNSKLSRDDTVALHWTGKAKPWKAEVLYPCGNTKKYCFCDRKEESAFKQAKSIWMADLLRVKNESNPIFSVSNQQQLAMKMIHVRTKAKNCS